MLNPYSNDPANYASAECQQCFVLSPQVIKLRSENALTMYNDLGYKGGVYVPGSQSDLVMFYTETKLESYEMVRSFTVFFIHSLTDRKLPQRHNAFCRRSNRIRIMINACLIITGQELYFNLVSCTLI